MLKLTLENGLPIIGVQRPRYIKQYVPLAVIDKVKELTEQLNKGLITQAAVDEQWGMYVLPHLKLPRDYNPQRDIVRLRVKRAVQTLVMP